MKRVGISTYYGDNYGACLQAYALQAVIENMGYNASIIENSTNISTKKTDSKLKKMINLLKNENVFNRSKVREFVLDENKRINKKCEEFRKQYLKIEKNGYAEVQQFFQLPPEFDVYISGSDQIWNPNLYGKCNPIYYLAWVPDNKRRISYSSSIGLKEIETKYEDEMKNYLGRYDYISVREENAVGLLKGLIDREITWVLDPTLLLRPDDYDKMECDIEIPSKPYIFCYLFGNVRNIEKIKKAIVKKLNLPVVSIPFVEREVISNDIKINDSGPVGFVNLIKNASFVITDSFHASAFSINYSVPFVSLFRQKLNERGEMSSRLVSILGKFDLMNRLIGTEKDIPEDLFDIDFARVQSDLERYRKESMDFLREALKDN